MTTRLTRWLTALDNFEAKWRYCRRCVVMDV